MLVIGVFTQTVWATVPGADVLVMVLLGVTVIIPLALAEPQPPVRGMV